MEGFIKIHRKIQKWGWYSDSHTFHLFLHFLLEANHEDRIWKGILIKRGQLIFGRKSVSETLGISERTVRTCLERLKTTSELTIKTTNRFSLVTIVNYEEYQDNSKETTSKTTSKLTNKRPATDQQPTTPKEYINNNNNITSGRAQRFVDFVNLTFNRNYKAIPKVVSNFNARISKDKIDPKVIMQVVENVKASTFHQDSKFRYATPEFLLRQSTIEKYKSGPIINKIFKISENPEPPKGQKYDQETNLYSEFQ